MTRKILVVSIFLFLSGCAHADITKNDNRHEKRIGISEVERSEIDGNELRVFFYDPTFLITRKYPIHSQLDNSTKIKQWFDYLYNSVVYAFVIKKKNTGRFDIFVMRGNPRITKSAYFYKLDILPDREFENPESLYEGYNTQGMTTIDNIPTRGTLLEHMAPFQITEAEKFVGYGVKFYGKYTNVTTYEEVKNAVMPIIMDVLKVPQGANLNTNLPKSEIP